MQGWLLDEIKCYIAHFYSKINIYITPFQQINSAENSNYIIFSFLIPYKDGRYKVVGQREVNVERCGF